MSARNYFPAIDSLRGIAVLIVVLFHLEIPGFDGGFIGVDVFFVISGFLITRNIRHDLEQNQFSFKQFYLARIRRLFPALLTTVALTLLFGFLLFSPDALIRLAGSSIAATLSLANIRFWMVSGYFDTSTTLKPLLHFWSLSVEEQFYFFWPALFVAFHKLLNNKWAVPIALLTTGIMSLYFAQIQAVKNPDLAFYWVQYRVCEFAFGAILIYFKTELIKKQMLDLALICGLLIIAYCTYNYSDQTIFPGLSVLAPCLGASLIIVSRTGRIANTFFINKPLLFIGRISYSIYLVHWPIWIYYSHWRFVSFSSLEKLAVFLIIILFAALLNLTVERHFRYPALHKTASRKHVFYLYLFFISSFILIISVYTRSEKGFPSRISTLYAATVKSPILCNNKLHHKLCENDINSPKAKQRILLLGDSHAGNFMHAFAQFTQQHHMKFATNSYAGCPPLIDVYITKFSGHPITAEYLDCHSKMNTWLSGPSVANYDVIILSSRWMWYVESSVYGSGKKLERGYLVKNSNEPANTEHSKLILSQQLTKTIKHLLSQDKKIILISQAPLMGKDISDCDKSPPYLINPKNNPERCKIGVDYNRLMQRLSYVNQTMQSHAGENILVITPSDFICDHKLKSCNVLTENGLLYQDRDHLSYLGTTLVIKSAADRLLKFITKP